MRKSLFVLFLSGTVLLPCCLSLSGCLLLGGGWLSTPRDEWEQSKANNDRIVSKTEMKRLKEKAKYETDIAKAEARAMEAKKKKAAIEKDYLENELLNSANRKAIAANDAERRAIEVENESMLALLEARTTAEKNEMPYVVRSEADNRISHTVTDTTEQEMLQTLNRIAPGQEIPLTYPPGSKLVVREHPDIPGAYRVESITEGASLPKKIYMKGLGFARLGEDGLYYLYQGNANFGIIQKNR